MVYFFSNKRSIKIGYTSGTIKRRLKQLNTGSDTKLNCIGYIQGDKEKEKELHLKFAKSRQNGEWFAPSEELITYINNNSEKPNTYVDYDVTEEIIREYFCIKTI